MTSLSSLCDSSLSALSELPSRPSVSLSCALRLLEHDPAAHHGDGRWYRRLSELLRSGEPQLVRAGAILLCAGSPTAPHAVVAPNLARWIEELAAVLRTPSEAQETAAIAAAAVVSRAVSLGPDTRRDAVQFGQKLIGPIVALMASPRSGPAVVAVAELATSAPSMIKPHSSRIIDSLSGMFDGPDVRLAREAGRCAGLVAACPGGSSSSQFAASCIGSFHRVIAAAFAEREEVAGPPWRKAAEASEIKHIAGKSVAEVGQMLCRASALCSAIVSSICAPLNTFGQQQQLQKQPLTTDFPTEQLLDLVSRVVATNADSVARKPSVGIPLHHALSVLPALHVLAFKLLATLVLSHGKQLLPLFGTVVDILCQGFWNSYRSPSPIRSAELREAIFACTTVCIRTAGSGSATLIASRVVPFILTELDVRAPETSESARLKAKPAKRKKGETTAESILPQELPKLNGPVSLAAIGTVEALLSTCVELLKPELQESISRFARVAATLCTTGQARAVISRCLSLCATSASQYCTRLLPVAISLTTGACTGDLVALGGAAIASVCCETLVHPRTTPVRVEQPVAAKPSALSATVVIEDQPPVPPPKATTIPAALPAPPQVRTKAPESLAPIISPATFTLPVPPFAIPVMAPLQAAAAAAPQPQPLPPVELPPEAIAPQPQASVEMDVQPPKPIEVKRIQTKLPQITKKLEPDELPMIVDEGPDAGDDLEDESR